MKKRIEMMVSSALVGFGLAILVLPLCLSGMRMLAATNGEGCPDTMKCHKSYSSRSDFDCTTSTCMGDCSCKKVGSGGNGRCVCSK